MDCTCDSTEKTGISKQNFGRGGVFDGDNMEDKHE
jgi:hypothetical protein